MEDRFIIYRKNAYQAMDTYAQQQIEAFKEKLKSHIKEIAEGQPDPETEFTEGYIEACDDFQLIIDGL